ncbi:serine threonine protein kinase [Zymoseptoria brevis]|uniref:Serine threonine protein kinase n=1 Tax=Zymoseptoria brevis TaxID=1047168 RepID=A0A0F4GFW5_9PEZI|nr:serine threonine protein kinase [Zymoseptoria brevis]
MATTLAGDSGRVYVQGDLLQRNGKDLTCGVFKAQSGTESLVLKRAAAKRFFDTSSKLEAECAGSPRLRLHVDRNAQEEALIYPYYESTLLVFMKDNPELHYLQRKKILRHVAEGIRELHSRHWAHLDIKPDNVFLNASEVHGTKEVANAALGDFDIAFKMEDGQVLSAPGPVGNPMWRSPEAQVGCGLTMASDIFSFGLVCLYAMGAGDMLIIDPKVLEFLGMSPEEEVLSRHVEYFGPASDVLYKRIGNETRRAFLKKTIDASTVPYETDPERRLTHWGQDLGPVALDIIGRMTSMDPPARPTITEILEHAWWRMEH